MIYLLRAEFFKLGRPLVLACVLLTVVLAALAMAEQQTAGQQAAKQISEILAHNPDSGNVTVENASQQMVTCNLGGTYPNGSFCSQVLAEARTSIQSDLQTRRNLVAVASLAQNPLGAGALAGGLLSSMLGFVGAVILGAGHVAGEWSGRTLKVLLIRGPNRWRLLAAKTLSLWLATVGMAVVTWAALAALGAYYRAQDPLNPIGSPGFHVGNGPVVFCRALVVLAAYSIVAVAAAVLTRSVVGALTAGIAFGLLSLVSGYVFTWAAHHEFVYWVTGFMGLYDSRMTGSSIYWLLTFATYQHDATFGAGVIGLCLLSAIAAMLAGFLFRRQQITL